MMSDLERDNLACLLSSGQSDLANDFLEERDLLLFQMAADVRAISGADIQKLLVLCEDPTPKELSPDVPVGAWLLHNDGLGQLLWNAVGDNAERGVIVKFHNGARWVSPTDKFVLLRTEGIEDGQS